MLERARKRLSKRAKRGFRGWPLATVALYGPDDTMATKLAVGIVPSEDAEATELRRWFSQGADIRDDARVAEEVLAFIETAGAKTVVMTDGIIGCPHEEGIDYEGATCPVCPFWAGRDRWSGKRLREPSQERPPAGLFHGERSSRSLSAGQRTRRIAGALAGAVTESRMMLTRTSVGVGYDYTANGGVAGCGTPQPSGRVLRRSDYRRIRRSYRPGRR